MFSIQDLTGILFLDIETARLTRFYEDLDPLLQKWWRKRIPRIPNSDATLSDAELFVQHAGIYAEFGRIVCVSVGFLTFDNQQTPSFRLKSFCGQNETQILSEFAELINKTFGTKIKKLCGHNIKEFDIPFLGRRLLVNQIELPNLFKIIQNVKPWEQPLVDTMNLWKFGDYKSFTSLELMATLLGIQTPKQDIDGAAVGEVFWNEADLSRIARYCEADVVATAQILLRLSNQKPLLPTAITSTTTPLTQG